MIDSTSPDPTEAEIEAFNNYAKQYAATIHKRTPLLKRSVDSLHILYKEQYPAWVDMATYISVEGGDSNLGSVSITDIGAISKEINSIQELGKQFGEMCTSLDSMVKLNQKIYGNRDAAEFIGEYMEVLIASEAFLTDEFQKCKGELEKLILLLGTFLQALSDTALLVLKKLPEVKAE